jgi:beta-galactosidase GanA
VFDFSHVDRVLAAMQRQGIKVIVGTPTYAIPTWFVNRRRGLTRSSFDAGSDTFVDRRSSVPSGGVSVLLAPVTAEQ